MLRESRGRRNVGPDWLRRRPRDYNRRVVSPASGNTDSYDGRDPDGLTALGPMRLKLALGLRSICAGA